jgi:hypothetical protein
MVEVHKGLLNQHSGSPLATFLDTPAGFQLNVDQISRKAVEYFGARVRYPLSISSFKSLEKTTGFDAQQAFRTLRESYYILIGPGSPTYAVRQWNASPVPEILKQCVLKGGCLVAASAAALTVGRFTLPVYEIYKVGDDLHWVDGMDILGHFGLHLVVMPHWNNAEGGTHDTRFCFMGEPRFRKLELLIPGNLPVFGLDEHTACILDFENDRAEIKGIGSATLRTSKGEFSFNSGERFPLKILRGGAIDPGWKPEMPETGPRNENSRRGRDSFWNKVHALEADFQIGIEKHDPQKSTNALLDLDRTIWQAQQGMENEETITQARDTFRELIVLLGTGLSAAPRYNVECLTPLVEPLLKLRQNFRTNKQWAEADAIRDILKSVHINVEDARTGSQWELGS